MALQQPQDMKKIFINEIRSRIEAYFKLIVRNLRDSIPKTIGMNLVKSIEENMQITLYNMLYKSQEVVNVLNEPESVMIRRKELTELRVFKRNGIIKKFVKVNGKEFRVLCTATFFSYDKTLPPHTNLAEELDLAHLIRLAAKHLNNNWLCD